MAGIEDLFSPEMASDPQKRAALVSALTGQMPQQASPNLLLMSNPMTAPMGQQGLEDEKARRTAGLQALAHALEIQKMGNEQGYRNAELDRQNRALDFDKVKFGQQQALEAKKLQVELARLQRELEKPVPEQEASKIVNQGQAVPAINKLEDLQKRVGVFEGLMGQFLGIHTGDEAKYHDAVQNLGSAVAAGAAPGARENAELMRHFEEGLPSGIAPQGRAQNAFKQLRDATHQNMEAQVSALKSGRYDPRQVAELQRQAAAAAAPTQPAQVRDGEVLMVDPKGRRHAVGANEVAEAEKHGWKRQ